MMTTTASNTPSMTVDPSDLSPVARWRVAVRALARVLKNPVETDQVLIFSTYANAGSNNDRLERFFNDPRGMKLFSEQRAIDSHNIDLDALYALPSGTLGHAYASFMKRHGLTPDVFDGAPEDIHDPRRAYVIQRMRQTHDLWHVVTNAETDPAGEVALQAFTWAQVGAPSAGILAALGMLKTLRHDRRILKDVAELIRLGRAADRLVVFPWEDHWATPIAEVRRLLKLPTSPRSIGGYTKGAFEAAA
jgi:ubiquinone biosynthesis protein COQ4